MSGLTSKATADFLNMASELSADEIKELVVATLLIWKAKHEHEVDFMTEVVMDVVSAMVRDAGGEVIIHEVYDDDWNDFMDELFGDDDYDD